MIILADDLTGACDVGAEFLRNNWPVRCLFPSVPGWREQLGAGRREALVLDMETRRLSPAKASRRAGRIASELFRKRLSPAYFKIDSTLRGNFHLEIEAVRKGARKRLSWLAPANPAMGRWTIGGRQFVNGAPIERTAFARDPLHPIRSGNVAAEARSRLGRNRCATLSLAEAARGPGRAAGLRAAWIRKGVRMVVADAIRDDDLRRLAGYIRREDLACGAASLARHCTPRAVKAAPDSRACPEQAGGRRGLAVIGSLNPVTIQQVKRAARRKGIESRRLGPGDLGREPAPPRPGARWLVLSLAPGKFRLSRNPRNAAEAGEAIARRLARHAARLMERWDPAQLLLSGGLTAAAVCEGLGVRELILKRELAAGLVLSEARAAKASYRAVTKPGGFGDADCLEELMR